MPKYLVEREIPGAGNMSPQQLQAVSRTSCGVLQKLGPQIQWRHSYVTGDKIWKNYPVMDYGKKWDTCEPPSPGLKLSVRPLTI